MYKRRKKKLERITNFAETYFEKERKKTEQYTI